jgi:hypothetical protein
MTIKFRYPYLNSLLFPLTKIAFIPSVLHFWPILTTFILLLYTTKEG